MVAPCDPFSIGFSNVAHSAGERISATETESSIAEAIVIENCR